MKFGPVALAEAEGAILAHSLRGPGYAIKKGTVLDASHIAQLQDAGIASVTVVRLGGGDVPEDEAARRIAAAACGRGLKADRAFTGRCNLRAESAGILRVDAAAVAAANAVDESLTLATSPDYARLSAGQLAATAKVIPYGAPEPALGRVCMALSAAPLALHPFRPLDAAFIVTAAQGQKSSVIEKGARAVQDRLAALGSPAPEAITVPHEDGALRATLEALPPADLVLILGGSATSDRRDVAPSAVTAAGGSIERFGMPVDPGNLLALGRLRDAPLVILPGCARSPALNGADWVLERLAARLPVGAADIAAMGVGGLLKEIPSRPQPREAQ